jgi:hypothetical protein
MKILKDANSTSEEQSKALTEVRNMYRDLFHLTEDEANLLPESFLTATENAEDLEAALKKDAEAWDRLQAKAARGIIQNSPELMASGMSDQLM